MKDEIKIKLHCYNHFAMDIVNDITNIIDAAYKYKKVIIDTIHEPFDLRQISWKGKTKLLDALKILCDKNNWPYEKFHIICWNPSQPIHTWPSMDICWEPQHFVYPAEKETKVEKNFKNHFGIYINNTSWCRLWLSAYLFNRHGNKTDQTLVRSPTNPAHMANLDLDAMLFYFTSAGLQEHVDLRLVHNLVKSMPMTTSKIDLSDHLDNHFNTNYDYASAYSPVADDILERYNNIFCDIVCETMFSGDCFSLDEKLARCFITETPFLWMANKNHLKKIRLLGFKTFHEFWNEDYDYTSDALRCVELAKVIDHLSTFDNKKLNSLYKEMTPILKHNKQRYLALCKMEDSKLRDMVLTINRESN